MSNKEGAYLREWIDKKGLKAAAVAKSLSVSRQTLYNYFELTELSSDIVNTLSREYGFRLNNSDSVQTVESPETKYEPKHTGKKKKNLHSEPPVKPPKRIPIVGEAAAGTDIEMTYTDLDNTYSDQYIDVGDLLRDSESAFIVYGNSMTPAYPSGCVLGVRHNADSFIQPGETYLINTKSNRIFKRLYYNEDRTGYMCYSDNTMMYETGPMKGQYAYPPFEIKFKDIISVFDVVGMIKRNRNTGIIQRQK